MRALPVLAALLLLGAGCENVEIAGTRSLKSRPLADRGWKWFEGERWKVMVPAPPVVSEDKTTVECRQPGFLVGVVSVKTAAQAGAATPYEQQQALDDATDRALASLKIEDPDLRRSDSPMSEKVPGRLATGKVLLDGQTRFLTVRCLWEKSRAHVLYAVRESKEALDDRGLGEWLESFQLVTPGAPK